MKDFLDSFYTYAMVLEPPPIFAKWAAISALSSIVQRRQWYQFRGMRSYFNLYIILCGPPTAGKGLAMRPIRTVLDALAQDPTTHQFIAPDSITAAALADELKDCYSSLMMPDNTVLEQYPLTVLCSELGNFLPEYDKNMLNRLIKLWDGEGYEERRRGAGKRLNIPTAHLNLIAGTTPAFLSSTLPEGAWEEGFMSRTVVVYHGEESRNEFFEEASSENVAARDAVIAMGGLISTKSGRIKWSPEAIALINQWLKGGCKPIPTHPKLHYYNGRRPTNLLKLCGLSAISRLSRTVEPQDFERMLNLLVETEAVLPDVFKAMRTGGDHQIMKEACHFLHMLKVKSPEKPIHRSLLFRFLQERAPAHSIERMISVMEQARLIKVVGVNIEPLGGQLH